MTDRRFGWAACVLAVLLLLGAVLSGSAMSAEPAGGAVSAVDAVIRPPLAPGRPAAGYFTLRGGKADEVLTGASSPAAERIELHRSSMAGGVMRMEAAARVPLPANGTLKFEPGGYHLMIFGLKPTSGAVPVKLTFASGRTLTINARVEAAATDSMRGMGSMGGAHIHH